MAPELRRILHVDMDAFYASVEQRDDPSLRGKPVVVGGLKRGVVAAASYEARRFGIRSAMPTARALRLCRDLIVVPPDFARYSAVSEQVFAIFREATPLVEGLSLDEAFLDVTENSWGEPLGRNVARRIKDRILEETRLTASAGVAPNKLLAKIASGWKKPDGLTVVPPERVDAFLRDLPVDVLWGVGPKTAKKLEAIGIAKVRDVRTADLEALRSVLGSYAECLVQLSKGIDDRPVVAHHERKSVGSENTFEHDLTDLEEIRGAIRSMALDLAGWLEQHQSSVRTVTIKVRYSNFETITRSDTRRPSTRNREELAARAIALLDRAEAGRRPVRLLGVSFHGFEDESGVPSAEGRQLLLPFAPTCHREA